MLNAKRQVGDVLIVLSGLTRAGSTDQGRERVTGKRSKITHPSCDLLI
jgi:hypothetical protein